MQKGWAFILTIIVAVAAFTPCCTIDDCQGDLLEQQDVSKPKAEGTCSPFFSCATCPGFTSTVKAIAVMAPIEPRPQYFESYVLYPSSVYAALPWQPPRIV